MASEQFSNNAQTTLSAAVTSTSATSISVTSAASFPAAAQFRVRIDDEILLVTGGAGTTTWTVTRGAEGTTAATHASGAAVVHVLTAGALGQFQQDTLQLAAPSGAVAAFAGGTVPAGWLACDGSAVSRTTYAALFAALGTTWGAGDGSTTFNLPDLRGRGPIGDGTGSGLSARTLGQTGGEEAHTLTIAEMPSHNHSTSCNGGAGQSFGSNDIALSAGGSSLTDSGSIKVTGGGGSHNNMQPYSVLKFIIKT